LVDKVERAAATSAPSPTRVDRSHSVFSEPDNAWVAERQNAITEGFEHYRNSPHHGVDCEANEDDGADRHPDHHSSSSRNDTAESERLSGESERIGSGNLDEDVPFGKHEGYV